MFKLTLCSLFLLEAVGVQAGGAEPIVLERLAEVEQRLTALEAGTVFATPFCSDPSINLRHVKTGFVCQTSLGVKFQKVPQEGFGSAWRELPSGKTWSSAQGKYTNILARDEEGRNIASEAELACFKVGGKLPSRKTYGALMNAFEKKESGELSAQGLRDLRAIFPDMKDRKFWSSSAPSTEESYYFDSVTGLVDRANSNSLGNVRCVARN